MTIKEHSPKKERDDPQDAELKLSSLMDSMPDFLCFKDGEGRWIEANAFALNVFQLDKDAYKGKKDTELVPPDHFYHDALKACEASDQGAWQRGGTWRGEEVIPRPEGGTFIFDVLKVPSFHPDGSRKALTIVGRDITERKKAETEAQLLQNAIESSIGAVAMADLQGKVTYVNPACVSLWGYHDKSEMVGRSAFEFWAYPESAKNVIAEVSQGETESSERVGKRKDGTLFDALISVTLVKDAAGKPLRMMVSAKDITERKKAETEVQLLQHAIESSLGAVAMADLQGKVTYVNPACARLWGYAEKSEMIGRSVFELGANPGNAMHILAEVSQGKIENSERVGKRKDGTLFDMHIAVNLVGDASGKPLRIMFSAEDITRRKQTENALLESEATVRALLNATDESIHLIDQEGRVLVANQTTAKRLGVDISDLIGKRIYDFFPPDIAGARQAVVEQLFATGLPARREDTRQGQIFESSFYPIKDAQGEFSRMAIFARDITERKSMEEKFLRTQRMETIGTLASGVAHDLNNILTPIILSMEILRTAEDPATRACLMESVEECAKRGADVVNQVLTFARGVKGERTGLQLQFIVGDMEKIASETFPKNIAITSSVPSDIWPVNGDTTQIHQVLLNLCINARDAMPEGGTLHISVENAEIDENFAAMVPEAKAGDYAMLAVTDTGMGISREIVPKIFDPFFTTKEVGKGTGLGLSTVAGIVRSHGGFVTVESRVGRGTTFKVFLPCDTEGTAEQKPLPPTEISQVGNGATILVVDDETFIARTLSMALRNQGYKVLTASDGGEALALYKKHAGKIALVLTDVMMPGMDGVALSRALKEINPRVKILASTGQATEIRKDELHALGVNVILHKPYNAKDLLAALHDGLHEESLSSRE